VNLDASATGVLVLVALSIGLVGVLAAVVALVQLARIRRTYALLEAAEGRDTFVDVVARTIEEFASLEDAVQTLDVEVGQVRRELAQALRHVSVVRYDAFGDLGGRFSFSAALLDDAGDGLILTSIHGRTETRTYMKGIHGGVTDIALSPEEQQAVQLAKGGA